MSADPYKAKIEAYVLGLLDEREARSVQQHLQSCAECKAQWAVLSQAAEHLDQGFDQTPPPYLRSRVIAQLKARKPAKPAWLWWGVPGLIGAAALVLVIKFEPGRVAQRQALESAPLEQPAALPVPNSPAPQAETAQPKKPAPLVFAREAEDKKKTRALPAPAAPAGPAPMPSLLNAGKREAESEAAPLRKAQKPPAEEAQDLAKADEAPLAPAPAPAKDLAVYGGQAAGSEQPTSSAAPAPETKAGAAAEGRKLASNAFREEKAFKQTRVLACVLSLARVQGTTNPEGVKTGLNALSQAVTSRIVRQGEAREVEMRVTLAPNGTVQSAAYVGQAFASEALNQFILAQAKRLNFGRPLDSAPAGFTFKISVQ